jgi:hypothetical protein
MLSSPAAKTKSGQPAPSRVSRFDDAFANDVVDSNGGETPSSKNSPAETSKNAEKREATTDSATALAKKQTSAANKKGADQSVASKKAARAATLLKLGQNLEKAGKTTAALGYFRQVAKDFAGTPAAKTAAERIKALGGQ